MADEILRLNALMPTNGCRKIAASFNHLYRRKRMSVGKTYVAKVLKREGHLLAGIRSELRRRRPRRVPKNVIWGLDLTYVTDSCRSQPVLGLIDHGTRACLALRELRTKSSIVILRNLLDVFDLFGKPKVIRTDNEPIFTSKLFRLGLWLLGIRHQTTAPFCPWQNGRIERFFGSLKNLWRLRPPDSHDLGSDLSLFRTWYNHCRPHQHLSGRTPAMAWDRREAARASNPIFFCEWDGILSGFLLE